MSGCYIPGCTEAPVVRLKYRDSLGELCTESRCADCARKLQSSDRTRIVESVPLTKDYEEKIYNTLTEKEREVIRRITDGPYGQFAA